MEEQQRLLVFHLLGIVLNHVVRVAIGKNQVEHPVVVIVEKLQAPSAEQAGGLRYAVLVGYVSEALVMVVLVKREHLLVDVGYEQILPAFPMKLRRIDAHSGARLPVVTEAYFGG